MPHVILSGPYGNRAFGRSGAIPGMGAVATTPQPVAQPVSAPAAPVGPPPDAKMIAQGIYLDIGRGDLWFNGARIAIISAVVSALAVKLVLFGGNKVGAAAKAQMARFKGEAKA
jgi:hypothetical protein